MFAGARLFCIISVREEIVGRRSECVWGHFLPRYIQDRTFRADRSYGGKIVLHDICGDGGVYKYIYLAVVECPPETCHGGCDSVGGGCFSSEGLFLSLLHGFSRPLPLVRWCVL